MKIFNTILIILGFMAHSINIFAQYPAGKMGEGDTTIVVSKDVARKMIQLVHDLNKKSKILDNKASCFMCHHGKSEPQTKAPEGQIR